jgi:hypothetical protein
MHADLSKVPDPSEDDIRNARLARGLRAVAATVIVGGIVIAALDTTAPVPRNAPRDSIDQVDSTASGVPLVSPAADVAPRISGQEDPALQRVDKAMEQHG